MASRGAEINPLEVKLFRVFGLWCPSCARSCERVLRNKDGIREAQLDFASGQLKLAFDTSKVSLAEVRALVGKLGFSLLEDELDSDPAGFSVEQMYLVSLAIAWFFGMWVTLLQVWTYFQDDRAHPFILGGAALLCLPALTLGAWPFWKASWHSLRSKTLSLDIIVLLGNTSLYCYSIWEWSQGRDGVFFDSIVMSISTILSLRWLDYRLRTRLVDRKELRSFFQRQDRVRVREEDSTLSAALSQISRGREIRLEAGEQIAFDGTLEEGDLWINTSLLSGESQARLYRPGTKLLAGMEVCEGRGLMRVERVIGERWIDQQLFRDRARTSERGSQRHRLERIYAYWLPGLLILATLGALLRPGAVFERLELFALVLLVGCPCLLLMAPTILRLRLAREFEGQGITLRHPDVLERIDGIQTLFWDKTGTLTRPTALKLVYGPSHQTDSEDLHQLARHLLSYIDHPLRLLNPTASIGTHDVRVITVPGEGSELSLPHQAPYFLGRSLFVSQRIGRTLPPGVNEKGLWLGQNGQWLAGFELMEELDAGRADLLRDLRRDGYRFVLASGDRVPLTPPRWLADFQSSFFGLSPEDKARLVETWRAAGPVAFIGDGLNDRAAMERADLSIAVYRPEQSPPLGAMLRVPESQLGHLPGLLRRLRFLSLLQNKLWIGALSYNGLMILAAFLGYLQPWLAVLLFAGVSATTLLVAHYF
jgi:Cu2+-exporting ATPase